MMFANLTLLASACLVVASASAAARAARKRRGGTGRAAALPVPLSALLLLASCTVKDNQAIAVTPEVVPSELWVAPDGLDSNPGTRAAPLRSLARAARVVKPGTVVNVLPGTYHGGFRTAVDGLPHARIWFRSVERWRARIVPPPVSASAMAWDNRASHVDIEGFDVDGSAQGPDAAAGAGTRWTTGIYSGGSYNRILANRVHHIATAGPCTSAGGSGIGVDSYYKGKDSQVVGNRVYDIGPPGCRWIQGIYVSTPATVRDNVVYRVAEAGIHLWHDAHRVSIVNNTVVDSNIGILVGGGDFYHTRGPNDHTLVENNIVFDNRLGILEQGATGKHNRYRDNLVAGNREADWRLAPGMTHSGTLAGAPGFLGYTRDGTPDLRLAADAPASARGMGAGARAARVDAGGATPAARPGAAAQESDAAHASADHAGAGAASSGKASSTGKPASTDQPASTGRSANADTEGAAGKASSGTGAQPAARAGAGTRLARNDAGACARSGKRGADKDAAARAACRR